MFHELIVSIKLAFRNLYSNVARTLLSLLGIVIGVASVILVLAFGAGVKNYVTSQVTVFGSDIIAIEVKVPKVSKTSSANATGQAGGTTITTFKLDEAEKIAKLDNIGDWYAMTISQQQTTYEDKKKQAVIFGVTAGVDEADKQVIIDEGQMFSEEDDKSLKQVAVLGSGIKEYYFGEAEAVGKSIKIKGKTFKVIGTLKSRGTMMGVMNFDDLVYVPLETVQKKLDGKDYIMEAIYKIKDMNNLDLTIAQATDKMRDLHNIDDPVDDDFAISSIIEVLDILSTVFSSLNILLLALVSISLVVGGVGIMNVMYVSVTERTFEIGLKKAVGARNSQILIQFLFEAIFLTLLGGLIGIVLGAGISQLAVILAASFGYTLVFPITGWSILVGFGFSAMTGIVFGYYPAKRASQLTPMEALRKE